MKKLFILIAGLIMISFMACGPSQQEKEKQKKTEDSLFEKERNTALDNANKLLSDTSSNTKDTVSKTPKGRK
jgi:hypothetical protein